LRRRPFITIAIALLAASIEAEDAAQQPAKPGEHDVWEISAAAATVKWLVIHNLAEGKVSGVFHVEVLERRKMDPPWRFKRLAPHLAITESALRASVRKPLRSGRVYPEQFDQAFAAWKKEDAAGRAPICDQTVTDCLKSH
jgi:hypothetical protein